ncbi:MAG TPA: flavin reductase family protein [Solirubrobacteraceae bacterium]|nr:flavin reductase family protein [Solirubrobacteraceae bacterium]
MAPERDEFERLMGQLDYALFIVTVADGSERSGCLVGFASQVSIHPPRFLICLSNKNHTFEVARRARSLVVHFVPQQAEDMAVLFGGQTGDDTDKFAQCQWHEGPGGAPVLSALEDWFAGRILERIDFGDHRGFLLEPIAGTAHRSGSPLTFRRAKWIEPGHEP